MLFYTTQHFVPIAPIFTYFLHKAFYPYPLLGIVNTSRHGYKNSSRDPLWENFIIFKSLVLTDFRIY